MSCDSKARLFVTQKCPLTILMKKYVRLVVSVKRVSIR